RAPAGLLVPAQKMRDELPERAVRLPDPCTSPRRPVATTVLAGPAPNSANLNVTGITQLFALCYLRHSFAHLTNRVQGWL
ncbi:hypothetical protein CEJ63_25790, partial [Acinetobacter baumannii]